ncbi:carboxypeptidase regulatory-like domain-containing protein [bacterium]|nr:carboxypeptidase regulatory-like domain-containing protein [bacterium]
MKLSLFRSVLLAMCGSCLLAACSGNNAPIVAPQTEQPLLSAVPAELLPPFPVDRSGAVVVDNQIKGSEFFQKSSGALASLNALSFNVPADGLEYAIYSFDSAGDPLVKLVLDISLSSGRAPWLGLADFSSGRWQFGAPLSSGTEEFMLTSGGDYTSPTGVFYFAVVGWDLSEFVINGANVQTDSTVTYTISGVVYDPLDALNVQDVEIFIEPGASSVLSDSAGAFSFSGLAPGSYTLTPAKAGYGFTPGNEVVEISIADVTDVEFAMQDLGIPSHSVSGNVQLDLGGGLENVLMTLTPGGFSIQTDNAGDFSIGGIVNGSYTLTPSLAGYEFAPTSINLTVSDADSTGNDFTGSEVVAATYSISGGISVGTSNLENVTITVNPGAYVTTTDSNGLYSVPDLSPGSYTVTPSLTGWVFNPSSQNVDIVASNVTGINFAASPDNNGTYSVSGVVSGPPGGLSGATITLTPESGPPINGVSLSGGGYSISNVPSGIYTATCTKGGWTITPFSQQVVVVDANVTAVNWFASPPF